MTKLVTKAMKLKALDPSPAGACNEAMWSDKTLEYRRCGKDVKKNSRLCYRHYALKKELNAEQYRKRRKDLVFWFGDKCYCCDETYWEVMRFEPRDVKARKTFTFDELVHNIIGLSKKSVAQKYPNLPPTSERVERTGYVLVCSNCSEARKHHDGICALHNDAPSSSAGRAARPQRVATEKIETPPQPEYDTRSEPTQRILKEGAHAFSLHSRADIKEITPDVYKELTPDEIVYVLAKGKERCERCK